MWRNPRRTKINKFVTFQEREYRKLCETDVHSMHTRAHTPAKQLYSCTRKRAMMAKSL